MTTRARFIVLWGTPQDPVEFDRHYREVHIPLARKILGLRRYTLSRDEAAIRGGKPYYRVAELDFDDVTAMREGFASPAGQATAADVAVMAAGATVRSMTYELEDVLEA